MNSEKTPGKTRRIVSAALAVLFLILICAVPLHAFFTNGKAIVKSVRYKKAKKYLADTENYDVFDMLSARVSSLQAELEDSTPYDDELGYMNASLQLALGKQLITAGDTNLVTLSGGQLVRLTTQKSFSAKAEEIVRFMEKLDMPCFFSYITPQFCAGGRQMPEGFAALDTSDELADEVLSIVSEAGFPAYDSRTFFEGTPYTEDELWMRTDMHWTTLAAIEAAKLYAARITELTGTSLDTSRLDIANFDTETYEDLFLGEYGQQIGVMNSGLDDITVYTPKYETSFRREWLDKKHVSGSAEGTFAEAAIRWDMLEKEPEGYSVTAYADYGLVEYTDHLTNLGDCADLTVLIFKDSYSAPVGTFLSLLVKDVYMVDMRTADADTHAIDFVEACDPDIVIVSYSMPMLELKSFTLE